MIMKEKETVFKVGQRVFSVHEGWGMIESIKYDNAYPVKVMYDEDFSTYELCGREYGEDKFPTLSFTNYIKGRFSQDPKDATYDIDFDWGCLSALVNIGWIAKDKNGRWYAYKNEPTLDCYDVFTNDDDGCYIEIHPDYYPKNSNQIDWKNSLCKKPNA